MTEDSMSLWTEEFHEVVDRSDHRLPPAWVRREVRSPQQAEMGRHVHESGRARGVARRVVELIAAAKEKAVVSSFLLADDEVEEAMLEAARRGVRVYVLLASEARLEGGGGDSEFDQRVVAHHKEMLLRLAGYVLFRSAPHFHAKAVLVDPDTQPAGLLLTANLTEAALERNEELAVELTPEEVREAAALAAWAMWETAEHEMVDPEDRFSSVKPLGRLQPPALSDAVLATTPEGTGLADYVLATIASAKDRLLVASFGWDEDHPVVERLRDRAREGVEVTVLARVRPASMPALLALAEAGARVLGFEWLHAKAVWADAGRAVVMSANLQSHGLDEGFELGVALEGERAEEVLQRLEAWAAAAPWRLRASSRLGDVEGRVKLWEGGRLEESRIVREVDLALGTVTAESAEELVAPMPNLPRDEALPRAHAVRCLWSVEPPSLAAGAKEVRRPTGKDRPWTSFTPPVFDEPGGRRVVAVTSSEELPVALVVKEEAAASAIVVSNGEPR